MPNFRPSAWQAIENARAGSLTLTAGDLMQINEAVQAGVLAEA